MNTADGFSAVTLVASFAYLASLLSTILTGPYLGVTLVTGMCIAPVRRLSPER
ncbi:MAG: hypothetical protein WCS96_13895 [Victivallales bacterium]